MLRGPGEVTGAGAVRDSAGAAWHVPCCALSPCTPGWSRDSFRKALFGVLLLGAHLPKVPGQSDLGEMGSLQGLRCKLQAPAVSPRLWLFLRAAPPGPGTGEGRAREAAAGGGTVGRGAAPGHHTSTSPLRLCQSSATSPGPQVLPLARFIALRGRGRSNAPVLALPAN